MTRKHSWLLAALGAILLAAGGLLVGGCGGRTAGTGAATSVAAATPSACWTAVLAAMRAGDEPAVRSLCTPEVARRLLTREDAPTALRRLGRTFSGWKMRWNALGEESASACGGPNGPDGERIHLFGFRKVNGQWLLAEWQPGE
jgi:hypothetical protein